MLTARWTITDTTAKKKDPQRAQGKSSKKAQGRPLGYLLEWLSSDFHYDTQQDHVHADPPSRARRRFHRRHFYNNRDPETVERWKARETPLVDNTEDEAEACP